MLRKYTNTYYENHREREKERSNKYYYDHLEEIRKRNRDYSNKYYQENREKIIENKKLYRNRKKAKKDNFKTKLLSMLGEYENEICDKK